MRPAAPKPRRVFGYARVSSTEQARGSSLRDQQESIRAYAEGRGLKVDRYFVEAESAVHEKFERREQVQALMREAREGDLIICDKLDRWSRDPEFSYKSVRELLEAKATMYFVAESMDPGTREGDSALTFRIAFAREEHKRIRERMVGTRKILRDQGFYVEGLPPYGYRRAHPKGFKGSAKNVLVVEEAEAETVRRAFRLCAGGRSISHIADAVGLAKDRVAKMLLSRVYTGEIQNSAGEWIAGKHPAIIDVATFVRAQDGRKERKHGGARPSSTPAETSTWVLRDVAVCGHCNARMSAAYAGPHEARRYYYRCAKRCTPRHVPVRLVELAFTPLVIERLTELREELAREPVQPHVRPVVDIAVKRAKLDTRRARYLEMYAEGLMAREAMLASVQKVDDELLRLRADEPVESRLASPAIRRSVLRDVIAIEHAWRHGDPIKRRALVGQLALKVALITDEEPAPTWRSLDSLGEVVS